MAFCVFLYFLYQFDGLNRLTAATHGAGHYTEKVTSYDKNGNILSLQRYGQTSASAYGLIDNLTFTLTGNRPTRVDDAVAASAYNNGFEFKDGVKQANEYVYDANGNLTKDLNKGISSIQYNVLNLPVNITFASGGFVQYGYTADGIKRRMMYKEANGPDSPVTTVYCSNVIYEGSVAKLLLTEEGYVTLSDKKYHYYLKDHQGNNRVVLNSTGTAEETNHYYPFGGVFASTGNIQPYKYNGKEYNGKKGLNLYDYGARHYDAALGRFTTVDPLAEKYYSMSPYAYCGSNPVRFIDPNGMNYTDYRNDKGELLFKTNDGLSEIIIIKEANVLVLESKGNELNEQGKIDNPQANKDELHPLGMNISEYKNSYKTGNDNVDNGYVIGYDITYNEKPGIATNIWMHIQGVSEEGAQILGGYYVGKNEGKVDKKDGRINKIEPFGSLKNNEPLIKLKK